MSEQALEPIPHLFHRASRLYAEGRVPDAQALYREILQRSPQHVESLYFLGASCIPQGKNDEALDLLRQALSLRPDYADAHASLGEALLAVDQVDAAVTALERAATLAPGRASPFINLGSAWQRMGDFQKALACFVHGIKLNPQMADSHYNLGNLLRTLGHWDDAIVCYQRAIALQPGFAQAHSNLGYAYKQVGRLDEAVAAFRAAIKLRPDHAAIGSGIAYLVQFQPGHDAMAIKREQQDWALLHAERLTEAARPHGRPSAGEADRRLRIGYVSPDFRDHCQSFFTVALLSNHDHTQFEIFCYSAVEQPDAITERLRSYSDGWRETSRLSDEKVAEMVLADRIDILVDLTMHMAGNRLQLFARKPAPIQVTWLAYPGTSGLSAMDYRLSDPYLDPPGMFEECYSEQTIRLPESFWCYDPLTRDPVVNAPPAFTAGHITFGCLNNFCKVNAGVVTLWSRVLRAVPGSRMIILCIAGESRERTLALFEQNGIAGDRIEFVDPLPRSKYLELYHRIDVALDTFPYNGHTTSLDALWMGVPVVTLVGQTVVGRAGLCQSMNLGMPEFIAQTPEEYVAIASREAAGLPRLATIRAELRARMESSPLMQGPRFARNMEAAYRKMWRRWCIPCDQNAGLDSVKPRRP